MASSATTRMLVRTREASPAALAFADQLKSISGYPTALVLDTGNGAVAPASHTAVEVSRQRCEELNLYCPHDFAWRCGDYGLYLARRRFPEVEHFWMIESDVRFCGPGASELFRFFDDKNDIDFLAADLRPSDASWYWNGMALACNTRPFRCLFPVTRLSSGAIDAAFKRRVTHSKQIRRRVVWPNDEALVATTLMNENFRCYDFNDFGTAFYSPETFYHGRPIDGDHFAPALESAQMIHPILFGEEYLVKVALLEKQIPAEPWFTLKLRKAAYEANSRLRW
jgi:hypothetical protein